MAARSTIRRWRHGSAPSGDVFYGDFARDYEKRVSAQPLWAAQQAVFERLIEALPAGSSVLDVPFGTGRFADAYRRAGLEVLGLDSSPDMVAEARRLYPEAMAAFRIEIGDATKLPFDDTSVDTVVCTRFLAGTVSFSTAKQVLAEFHRVVRSTALLDLGSRAESSRATWPPRDSEPMQNRADRTELRAFLEESGFAVREIVTCSEHRGGIRLAVVCDRID